LAGYFKSARQSALPGYLFSVAGWCRSGALSVPKRGGFNSDAQKAGRPPLRRGRSIRYMLAIGAGDTAPAEWMRV
jgi:hypothetical protein